MIPSIRTISHHKNAAPNQDRPSTMFHWRPQALILPSLSNSSSRILSTIGPKNLDSSLHNILFHWCYFQSLWALEFLSLFTLFPFLKKWFLGCYPSTKNVPDQASLDCRRVNLASRWSCQILSHVFAGLPSGLSKKKPLRNFSSDLESFLGLSVLFCPWPLLVLQISL